MSFAGTPQRQRSCCYVKEKLSLIGVVQERGECRRVWLVYNAKDRQLTVHASFIAWYTKVWIATVVSCRRVYDEVSQSRQLQAITTDNDSKVRRFTYVIVARLVFINILRLVHKLLMCVVNQHKHGLILEQYMNRRVIRNIVHIVMQEAIKVNAIYRLACIECSHDFILRRITELINE